MNDIYNRKGDSLEALRNGHYPCGIQDMNTAVILNQSRVFQSNEWKGGRHYPVFQSGYHLPIQNMLPITGLKQLSLGKTDNKWANLNGIYSPQIPMVPIFSSPHLTLTSVKPPMSNSVVGQNQRTSQSIASTNVPEFGLTVTKNNTKTTGMHGQRATKSLASTNAPQFSPTQSNTKSTRSYHQSVIQNFGGYQIQNLEAQQSSTINHKPPSNSSVNLTELRSYKDTHTNNSEIKTMHAKQRELTQTSLTRKRSSSWPSRPGLSKKKPKDGLTKDDQIIEEYKNLEMDVARILISDIPYPVLSVGDKSAGVEKSFVRSVGEHETNNKERMSPVARRVMEAANEGKGSNLCGRMSEPNKELVVSPVRGGVIIALEKQGNRPNPWNGGMPEPVKQANSSSVERRGVMEPGKEVNRSNAWEGGMQEPSEEVNWPHMGSGEVKGPEEIPEPNKQAKMSFLGNGELMETAKEGNRSNVWSAGMPEPFNIQANSSPVRCGDMTEKQANRSNARSGVMSEPSQQGKSSPLASGEMPEPNKQANTSSVGSGGKPESNKQENKSVDSSGGIEPEKHCNISHTHSDTSLHFENEKENYSKNLVNPNKVVFTCQQCIVTFESTQDLIAHTASHASSDFTFKCNACTQVFRSTNGLQKHIEFHADHRNNFQCSFCFKPFPDRDSLEEHIISSHMSKRPHKCSHCPKAFRDPGSLQKHIRIHTGERPYKCTACDKSFAEYSSLRKHYRVHTGEQPYKCQYCPKAFSISGNLQRHILIHTGERPYKCSDCSKTFNNPSHLRRHEKNLHSKLDGEK